MAVYHRQDIASVGGPTAPNLAQLGGGRIARRKAIPGILRAQDRAPALGRRIVAAQSLKGEIEWLTPDDNPTSGANTHPDSTTYRVVARARAEVTPGHFLRLSVLCVPSGQTQVAGQAVAAGAFGTLRVTTTWTDQASNDVTTTHNLPLPASAEEHGQAPANPWAAIRLRKIDLVAPPDIFATDDLAAWTGHVGALITISHLGGVRVIDMCLSEVPYAIARESDDAADLWTSHIGGSPDPSGALLSMDHAWQRWSETTPDGRPQGGTWHMLDVAHAQGLRLGPSLIHWTSYTESGMGVTADDVADASPGGSPFSTTSSTFVGLADATLTAYDEDEPGWTLSSQASSADYAEDHPYWSGGHGSMATTTVPVLVAVYGSGLAGDGMASDSGGTVRVQSSPSSWVDCTITSGSGGWYYGYGHLEVGAGPGDERTAQIFVRRTSGSDPLLVSSLSVYRLGQVTPAT